MGEWLEREEWERQQQEKKQKNKEKHVIPISADIAMILNPAIDKIEIQNFLACSCGKRKSISSISDGMIRFKCRACGTEYGYTDDHMYFNIKKQMPKQEEPTTDCTCSDCPTTITKAQAVSSFEFLGRKLCMTCMGKELAC